MYQVYALNWFCWFISTGFRGQRFTPPDPIPQDITQASLPDPCMYQVYTRYIHMTCMYQVYIRYILVTSPQNLKDHISLTNHPFEMSQRTLILVRNRQIVLLFGAFDRYATIWSMIEKRSGASSSVRHETKLNCPISVHSDAPRTTRVEGQVCHVWAFPDDPCRFYSSGKTCHNTDSLKIEYPKNSLFRPDKWAPAPPGDWYTRGEVGSGTACSMCIPGTQRSLSKYVKLIYLVHTRHISSIYYFWVKHAFWCMTQCPLPRSAPCLGNDLYMQALRRGCCCILTC